MYIYLYIFQNKLGRLGSFYQKYGFAYDYEMGKPETPVCGPANEITRKQFWDALLCHRIEKCILGCFVNDDVKHLGSNDEARQTMLKLAGNL